MSAVKKAKVEIYTTGTCSYCQRAKQLLMTKHVPYTEIRIDLDESKQKEMLNRSEGRRTVPQIFINGKGIGGFSELAEMEQAGKLDPLLHSDSE